MRQEKKRKFKLVVFCVIFLFLLIIGVRIAYVNFSATKIETKIHVQNEWVNLGRNYQYVQDENCDGYSVKVISADWISFEELCKNSERSQDYELKTDYSTPIVLIKLRIRNIGNDNGYLLLKQYLLMNCFGNTFYSYDSDLLCFLNAELPETYAVSIPPNSEYDLVIPYVIDELRPDGKNDITDSAQESPYYLCVSEFPVKNRIKICF